MIIIQAPIKFFALRRSERNLFRHSGNAVPNVSHKLNALHRRKNLFGAGGELVQVLGVVT